MPGDAPTRCIGEVAQSGRNSRCQGPGVGNEWPEHGELGAVKGPCTWLQAAAGGQYHKVTEVVKSDPLASPRLRALPVDSRTPGLGRFHESRCRTPMGAAIPGGEADALLLGLGLPIALCLPRTHDVQPRGVSQSPSKCTFGDWSPVNAAAAVGVSDVPRVICSVNRALLDSPVCLSSAHTQSGVAGSPAKPQLLHAAGTGKPERPAWKGDAASTRDCGSGERVPTGASRARAERARQSPVPSHGTGDPITCSVPGKSTRESRGVDPRVHTCVHLCVSVVRASHVCQQPRLGRPHVGRNSRHGRQWPEPRLERGPRGLQEDVHRDGENTGAWGRFFFF